MADAHALPLRWHSAAALASQGAQGTLQVQDVVASCLARIAAREAVVQAWAWCDEAAVHRQVAALPPWHPQLPLWGIPVGIKDIIDTADMPTQYGSRACEGHQPQADAVVVQRLRAAGAVLMGKTQTVEFAYAHPGPTGNPHRVGHTPGGSSSGSAAAVADGMVTLALGTQTGGSTIRPSAYCGVVGFKPTRGLVPLAGVRPLSTSMDTIGVHARSVDDAALLFGVLAGVPVAAQAPAVDGAPLRLALYAGPHTDEAQPAAVTALHDTWRALRQAGIVAVPLSLPNDPFAGLSDTNRIIMAYEGARELATIFQRSPELLGAITAKMVQTGLAIAPADYRAAVAHAALCARLYAQRTQGIDALVTFSAPGEAPPRAEGTGSSVFNRAWTTMGLPCLTLPSGVGPAGLPLGLQLVGRAGHDAHLLQVGRRVAALLRGGGAAITPPDAFT